MLMYDYMTVPKHKSIAEANYSLLGFVCVTLNIFLCKVLLNWSIEIYKVQTMHEMHFLLIIHLKKT